MSYKALSTIRDILNEKRVECMKAPIHKQLLHHTKSIICCTLSAQFHHYKSFPLVAAVVFSCQTERAKLVYRFFVRVFSFSFCNKASSYKWSSYTQHHKQFYVVFFLFGGWNHVVRSLFADAEGMMEHRSDVHRREKKLLKVCTIQFPRHCPRVFKRSTSRNGSHLMSQSNAESLTHLVSKANLRFLKACEDGKLLKQRENVFNDPG